MLDSLTSLAWLVRTLSNTSINAVPDASAPVIFWSISRDLMNGRLNLGPLPFGQGARMYQRKTQRTYATTQVFPVGASC